MCAQQLEHSLVSVPREALLHVSRNAQKVVAKEMADVVSKANGDENVRERLGAMAAELRNLKRKLQNSNEQSTMHLQKMRQRVQYLLDPNADHAGKMWLNRVIVDHILRQGCFETGSKLAERENLSDFIDFEAFQTARNVQEDLRAHSCSKALAWFGANRAKLTRLGSSFEFKLRLQEFVEMIRPSAQSPAHVQKLQDSIIYARSHLSGFFDKHFQEIQEVLGCLVFVGDPAAPQAVSQVRDRIFSPDRWLDLEKTFYGLHLALNGLPMQSLLTFCLQAGLSSLRTPWCCKDSEANEHLPECPVCFAPLFDLAQPLAATVRQQSSLVCRISGCVMAEKNPPVALPNGNVYSKAGLLALPSSEGLLQCPQSNALFHPDLLKPVFIL